MKKFLSLLLILSLLLGMSLSATAATSGQLVDGDNEIELPWDRDDASVYTYTATRTGTLYISAVEFNFAMGDYNYEDNMDYMNDWETYTRLTVDGQLLDGLYYGSVEVVEGQTYTFSWAHSEEVVYKNWYDFGWSAVLNLSYSGDLVPELGSEELPVELYVADCPTESIQVPAGGTVWYMLYDFGETQFTVTGENAYVVMSVLDQATMQREELVFEAENGVVTVPCGQYHVLIQIGNNGDEAAVFGLDYYYLLGSRKNPASVKLGENKITLEKEDDEGYHLKWVAECDGTLKLTMPAANWMAALENVTADTGMAWYDSSAGNVLTIEVSAGDEILLTVIYINERTGTFPGGDVIFTAAAIYDHDYVDGVCSHCGAQESGEEEVLVGDVNGDGRINARDARALLRIIAGLDNAGEVDEAVCDVNGDGRVNARDARALLRQIAGLE